MLLLYVGTTDSCFLTLSTHVISSVKDASDNSPEEKVIVIYLTIHPSVTKFIAWNLKFVKDEKKNLLLIDVKSPTASCWWNENLDLVNTPTHSFSSSQWDCSEVVISLIWKKKKRFFVFFIPEVQCIYFFFNFCWNERWWNEKYSGWSQAMRSFCF